MSVGCIIKTVSQCAHKKGNSRDKFKPTFSNFKVLPCKLNVTVTLIIFFILKQIKQSEKGKNLSCKDYADGSGAIYAVKLGTAGTNNKLLSFLLISWYLTEQMYLGVLEFSSKFWRSQDPPHSLFWYSLPNNNPLRRKLKHLRPPLKKCLQKPF